MSSPPATSQHRPAPPAGGEHHAAARGGPGPQRPGPLPAGRHQGRTRRRRGEEREHGRRLHGGEGVPGGEREEPTVGRRGRQQRSRSQTDGREDRGHGELDPPHSSGGPVQGTDNSACPSSLTLSTTAQHKQINKRRHHSGLPWLITWSPLTVILSLQHIRSSAATSSCLLGSGQQISEATWLCQLQPGRTWCLLYRLNNRVNILSCVAVGGESCLTLRLQFGSITRSSVSHNAAQQRTQVQFCPEGDTALTRHDPDDITGVNRAVENTTQRFSSAGWTDLHV